MRATFVLLLFCLLITVYAQIYLEGKTKPTSVDMSMAVGANKAKAFLQLLGLEPGDTATYYARFSKRFGVADRRQWEFKTKTSLVMVDSQSGMITSYNNDKREDDRYRGRGRTGKKFTTSESVAKAHLRQLATKLGIPSQWEIANFSMVGDGIGNDSNPMGHFGCAFKDTTGRVVATLGCDLQDGTLLHYSRR